VFDARICKQGINAASFNRCTELIDAFGCGQISFDGLHQNPEIAELARCRHDRRLVRSDQEIEAIPRAALASSKPMPVDAPVTIASFPLCDILVSSSEALHLNRRSLRRSCAVAYLNRWDARASQGVEISPLALMPCFRRTERRQRLDQGVLTLKGSTLIALTPESYLPPGCLPELLLVPGPTLPSLDVLPREPVAAPVVPSRAVPLRSMAPLPLMFEVPVPFVVAELLVGPLSEPALPWLD
jgi:hypothetical protein